jgi:hypothetical protein
MAPCGWPNAMRCRLRLPSGVCHVSTYRAYLVTQGAQEVHRPDPNRRRVRRGPCIYAVERPQALLPTATAADYGAQACPFVFVWQLVPGPSQGHEQVLLLGILDTHARAPGSQPCSPLSFFEAQAELDASSPC